VVATSSEQIEEAVMRLARVGHETVKGFILINDYAGEKPQIEQTSVEEINEMMRGGKNLQFVDVRRPAEHVSGHAPGTINISLDRLGREFDMLDPNIPTYVICQSGYRSSIGTSILENAGFKEISNVAGGTTAWIAAGFDVESSDSSCSTSI
jgi:hydroxyacylglutathione hydrolase